MKNTITCKTIKYIISRDDESLTWLNELPHKDVIVYNSGPLIYDIPNIRNVIRVLHNKNTYLSYITSNYNNLPDVMVFSTGSIVENLPKHYKRQSAEFLKDLGLQALHTDNGLSQNFKAICIQSYLKKATDFRDWFTTNINKEYPSGYYYGVPYCTFAITKQDILTRPKRFYLNILLDETVDEMFVNMMWYYVPVHLFKNVRFYSILLKHRLDRFEKVNNIKTVLPSLNVIDAIDAGKFSDGYIQKLKEIDFFVKRNDQYVDASGKPYQLGDVGCFLSHKKALEIVEKQDAPYAIIMEDDISILSCFHKCIYKVLEILEGCDEFDIVNLCVNMNSKGKTFVSRFCPEFSEMSGFSGTMCYLVKKSAVRSILKSLQQYDGPMSAQFAKFAVGYINLPGANAIQANTVPSYIKMINRDI